MTVTELITIFRHKCRYLEGFADALGNKELMRMVDGTRKTLNDFEREYNTEQGGEACPGSRRAGSTE